ncbi:MAG: NAD-dependent epimerase/dehydratase family protein [Fuerstiella sp.]
MPSRVLITGICGFVGSEIALALRQSVLADQLQIVGLDNLSRNGSWRNRERLQSAGLTVHHGDIRCSTDLDAIGPVDWVIDAAANPSVLAGVDGNSSSRQLVDYNLSGTINLLEFCRQHAAGFVLLSTSRVYSIPPLAGLQVEAVNDAFRPSDPNNVVNLTANGISESFSTMAPVSLYGATKLASEQLALEYGLAFDFPVWINRCGVMAGAGQFGKADQGIFAFWLHSWKEKRPLRYIGFDGQGHQVRDCLHPRDLVPLLQQQMNCDDRTKPPIVNVSGGTDSARSLAHLSDWCRNRWGENEVSSDPTPRPFDLPWIVLDSSLAQATWDWQPQTSTEQILNEIADFAETQPDWITFSK